MDKGFAGDAPRRERRAPSSAAARFDTCETQTPARALHALHTRPGTHVPRRARCSATPASVAVRHHRRARARVMRARNGLHRRNIAKASQGHGGGIEALRSSQAATTAKHRGNTPAIAPVRSRRADRSGARAPRFADAFAPSRRSRQGAARCVVRPLRGLLQRLCAGAFCCATKTRKRPLRAGWRETNKRRGRARAGPRRIAARRLRQ